MSFMEKPELTLGGKPVDFAAMDFQAGGSRGRSAELRVRLPASSEVAAAWRKRMQGELGKLVATTYATLQAETWEARADESGAHDGDVTRSGRRLHLLFLGGDRSRQGILRSQDARRRDTRRRRYEHPE